MPLPSGFLFGVATSGFQSEGGYNGPGQPANNWAAWERSGRVARSGPALDFWNRYPEHLDRAAAIGCTAIRISVEWARCEPSPGMLDEAAFARYRDILAACHRRGLEPVVALHHFTHPAWLGPDFWLHLDAPERFARWCGAAVARLGDGCRHWLTINELNVVPFATYVTGGFPPGRRLRTGDAVRALGHLLTAHVLAYRAVHLHRPDAVVSTNNHALSVYELDRLLLDVLVGRSRGVGRHDLRDWLAERRRAYHAALPAPGARERAVRALVAGAVPLDAALPRAATAVYAGPEERPLDLVQLNYYDPSISGRLRPPGRRTVGGRDWSPFREPWEDGVWPEGLALYCRLNLEPGLDLWVAENGLCNRVRDGVALPRLDGWDRVRYLRANLAAVEQAAGEGLPVTGYFHWTLADNYEWGSYEHRFGLHRVDSGRWLERDAFGSDAAGAYRDLIAALRGGPAPVAGSPRQQDR
jgi:beta-glucosidase/6-phospho-beta-glucosidase/beta-galactosidase